MRLDFAHPIYLWLLASIPLLITSHFLLLRYNQYRALKFANFNALKRVTGQRLITKNYLILSLRLGVLLLLILAITGPVLYLDRDVTSTDYVIAIDTSASMSAQDFPPSRFDAAKHAAGDMIDRLPGTSNIAIITFSGATFVEQTLTRSRFETRQAITKIDLQKAGGTDIPGAIITGTNLLSQGKQGKAIIILTDGSNTAGTFLENSIGRALDYAQGHDVRIYAIGIGSESGPIGYLPSYYNISATYNEENLVHITNQTGGVYYAAADLPSLDVAYTDILRNGKRGLVPHELSFGFLVIALMLLFIEWGLINSRFRRFP